MPKGPSEIRSLARSHTAQALKTLVGIMGQAKAPAAARVAAANSILDRGWGKSPQIMTVRNASARELADDELAAIALGGSEGADLPEIDPSQLN